MPANDLTPPAQSDVTSATEDKPAEPETTAEVFQEAATAADEDVDLPEVPRDPEPTIAPSPKPTEEPQVSESPVVEEPAAAPKPTAPKTWASMVAGPKAPIPAVPQVPPPSSAAAPSKASSHPPPAAVATTSTNTEEALPSPGGWQTAGQEHGRRQARQQSGSVSGVVTDKGNVSAYIKGVIDKVDAASLKSTLSKYGKLDYFDVSRAKVRYFTHYIIRANQDDRTVPSLSLPMLPATRLQLLQIPTLSMGLRSPSRNDVATRKIMEASTAEVAFADVAG